MIFNQKLQSHIKPEDKLANPAKPGSKYSVISSGDKDYENWEKHIHDNFPSEITFVATDCSILAITLDLIK